MYSLNSSEYGTHKIVARELFGKKHKILDVGCNEGYIRTLVSDPGVFFGVDRDDDILKVARSTGYSKTYNVDLNAYPYKVEIDGRFDFILFIDVLEHLINPVETIRYFKKYLKESGAVIISLPNVANIFIRLNLLFGIFDYTEEGILDETHLRLFTRKSAKEMLKRSGLKIIKEKYSSNRFGPLVARFPFLGGLLGYNLIYVCEMDSDHVYKK